MNLEQVANIATIFEAIAVIASLIFIGLQIRQNTKLAKATNIQSLVNLSSPFNLLLAQDRKLTEVWLKGAKQFSKMDEIDKTRYMFLLFHTMTLQEHIYYQWENRLIAEANYQSWNRSFETFVKEHNLWLHWDAIKDFYEGSFSAYVENLVSMNKSKIQVTQKVRTKK